MQLGIDLFHRTTLFYENIDSLAARPVTVETDPRQQSEQQMPDQIGQAFTFPGYPPECFDVLIGTPFFQETYFTFTLNGGNRIIQFVRSMADK